MNIEKVEKYLKEFALIADKWFKEHEFVEKRYAFFQEFKKRENLEKADWAYFQKLGNNINAFVNLPLARGRALGKPNHDIEHYREHFINLIYGEENIDARINSFITNVRLFGLTVVSEILGNIFPDKYIFYCYPDQKGANILDIDIDFEHDKLSPGKQYLLFNEAIKPLVALYEKLVGRRTSTSTLLEVDQFLFYLSDKYNPKRYWAGGFHWDDVNKLDDFLSKGYWQIGWGKKDEKGQIFYKRIKDVNIGDLLALKSYGGKHDLTIYAIGQIIDITEKKGGILKVEWLKTENLYKGKAPSGNNAGNWQGTLLKVVRNEDIEKIFDVNIIDEGSNLSQNNYSIDGLNTILYGPPGTGKTYKILNEYIPKYFIDSHKTITKEDFLQELVSELTWWQVIGLALYDLGKTTVPELGSHLLVIEKSKISSSKNINAILWGQLQAHTVNECNNVHFTNRQEPLIFTKDKNSVWELKKDQVDMLAPEIKEKHISIKDFKPLSDIVKRYSFITFHQNYTYEDFIEGIKPTLSDPDMPNEIVNYSIEKGVFKRVCEKALLLAGYENFESCFADKREIRKEKIEKAPKYAMFIDEINRANIASVFGELITLIEKDKRLGANNEITDTILPYSKSKFGVPANLYIIGTMNTADRSVEALDTALRRRFSFTEMSPELFHLENLGIKILVKLFLKYSDIDWQDPKWELIEDDLKKLMGNPDVYEKNKKEIENLEFDNPTDIPPATLSKLQSYELKFLNFSELLSVINNRIEKLLNKDHCIGHSYFLEILDSDYPFQELKNVFKNKILPLLKEYFYGDYGKIGLILGNVFVEEIKDLDDNKKDFAFFDYDEADMLKERKIFRVKDTDEDFKVLSLNSFLGIYL